MKMDLLSKFQSLILTKALLKLSEEVNKPSNNSIHVLPPAAQKQQQTKETTTKTSPKKNQTQQLD